LAPKKIFRGHFGPQVKFSGGNTVKAHITLYGQVVLVDVFLYLLLSACNSVPPVRLPDSDFESFTTHWILTPQSWSERKGRRKQLIQAFMLTDGLAKLKMFMYRY